MSSLAGNSFRLKGVGLPNSYLIACYLPEGYMYMLSRLFVCSRSHAMFTCNHKFVSILLAHSSKDVVVKLWDLETQHCFQTIVGHRSEVWSIELIKGESRLLTASGQGGSVKVFSLQPPPEKEERAEEKVKWVIKYTIFHLIHECLYLCTNV